MDICQGSMFASVALTILTHKLSSSFKYWKIHVASKANLVKWISWIHNAPSRLRSRNNLLWNQMKATRVITFSPKKIPNNTINIVKNRIRHPSNDKRVQRDNIRYRVNKENPLGLWQMRSLPRAKLHLDGAKASWCMLRSVSYWIRATPAEHV